MTSKTETKSKAVTVTTKQKNGVVPTTKEQVNIDRFLQGSAAENSSFLKFIKGEWSAGVDAEVVPVGTEMAVNVAGIASGHLKWVNREVVGESMTLITDGMFAPRDASSLAVFRISFAVIMLWEIWRYFDHGWIARYWITPTFYFGLIDADWLRPWPGDGMVLHFYALAVAAVFIGLGLFYRFAAAAFCIGFTYVFLLDESRYLNHFYLVCLVSALMVLVPADRTWSLAALWGRQRAAQAPA